MPSTEVHQGRGRAAGGRAAGAAAGGRGGGAARELHGRGGGGAGQGPGGGAGQARQGHSGLRGAPVMELRQAGRGGRRLQPGHAVNQGGRGAPWRVCGAQLALGHFRYYEDFLALDLYFLNNEDFQRVAEKLTVLKLFFWDRWDAR